MASVTLPNGVRIDNLTDAQLKSIITGNEDGVHYFSQSRGKIKISEMATPHIRNAVAKMLDASLTSARKLSTNDYVNFLQRGIISDNITVMSMVKELSNRRD